MVADSVRRNVRRKRYAVAARVIVYHTIAYGLLLPLAVLTGLQKIWIRIAEWAFGLVVSREYAEDTYLSWVLIWLRVTGFRENKPGILGYMPPGHSVWDVLDQFKDHFGELT